MDQRRKSLRLIEGGWCFMAAVIKEAVDINEGGGSLKAAPRRSGRSISKKVVDLTLYWVFCALAGTGLLLAYRLPHGAGAVTFLGHGLHDWGVVHTWLAYAALCLLVIHLVLNREWLVKIAASKRAWRLVVPVFGGILLNRRFSSVAAGKTRSPSTEIKFATQAWVERTGRQ